MRTDTITVREAASRLGIGINQAYEACERGEIPSIRLGKRWLIPTVAFQAWLANGGHGATGEPETHSCRGAASQTS